MRAAIELTNVSVERGGQQVLRDLTLQLPEGGIVGLLGPNGAGKTTLMRAIVGRQRIQKGTIKVLGLPAGSPQLRLEIGYMTQASSVYPDLTVRENISYFAAMTGQPKSRIAEAIQEVSLTEKAHALVSHLSGGQRSRVSLAAALINKPKILILDEPTVGLDPVLRRQLWHLFHRLADQGCTLLVSSHVMDEAHYCKQLVLMREGEVIASGTASELTNQTHTTSIEDSFIALVGDTE